MIKLRTEEELEVAQQFLQESLPKTRHEQANTDTAAGLTQNLVLTFRGHLYKVPPIPYRVGVQLERVRLQMSECEDQDDTVANLNQFEAMLDGLIPLFKMLVMPVDLIQRIGWRWRKNPFADASAVDVMTLLHFFLLCRTKSSVKLVDGSGFMPQPSLSTTPQTT